MSKGTDFSGDGTATYVVDKELSAELKVTDKGVAKVSVTKSGLVDGLKTVASVNPSDVAKSLKLANTLLSGDVGVKADVSNCLGGNPKVEASACLNLGDAQVRTTTPPRETFLVFFPPAKPVAKPSPNELVSSFLTPITNYYIESQVGAEAAVDAAKGVVSYALAAQLAADDLVLSAVLSDELSTIKAGAALKVDKDTTAAAEVLYKLNGGDLKLAGGIATKLESGQSVRAVVCSAGHISASLKTSVADGLDLTACAQVHKDMKYKYGLQFAMKT